MHVALDFQYYWDAREQCRVGRAGTAETTRQKEQGIIWMNELQGQISTTSHNLRFSGLRNKPWQRFVT